MLVCIVSCKLKINYLIVFGLLIFVIFSSSNYGATILLFRLIYLSNLF